MVSMSLVCPVYSKHNLFTGYWENIYIHVLDNKLRYTHAFLRNKSVVRGDKRNQEDNLGWSYRGWEDAHPGSNARFIDAQSAKKLSIHVHNVRTDVEHLLVSRPEDNYKSLVSSNLSICLSMLSTYMYSEFMCYEPICVMNLSVLSTSLY